MPKTKMPKHVVHEGFLWAWVTKSKPYRIKARSVYEILKLPFPRNIDEQMEMQGIILSLITKIKRLEAQIKEKENNMPKKIKENNKIKTNDGTTLLAVLLIVLSVVFLVFADRQLGRFNQPQSILASPASTLSPHDIFLTYMAQTPDMTKIVDRCIQWQGLSAANVVPYVQYTPNKTQYNHVCHGGVGGSYIGACPCFLPVAYVFSGTQYVVTFNALGTPLLTGTWVPETPNPLTATATPTRSTTPTNTQIITQTPTRTPTRTQTPTNTATRTQTNTATRTATNTATLTPIPSNTATKTATNIPTKTPTRTPTITMTVSLSPTPSATITAAPENMCLMIKTSPSLSARAMTTLSVPPLFKVNFGTIIMIEGIRNVYEVDNPDTTANEALGNGIWAVVNRGIFMPIDLVRDGMIYSEVQPCEY